MAHWKKAVLAPDASLGEAIKNLDESALQIALVVDSAGKLLGTITDGDVRRAILRSETLDAPVGNVMKANPITAGPDIDRKTVMR